MCYICKYHPTSTLYFVLFFLQDSALESSLPVLDLIDAMKAGAIDYSLVVKSPGAEVRAHLLKILAKLAKLAVMLSWLLQNGLP